MRRPNRLELVGPEGRRYYPKMTAADVNLAWITSVLSGIVGALVAGVVTLLVYRRD